MKAAPMPDRIRWRKVHPAWRVVLGGMAVLAITAYLLASYWFRLKLEDEAVEFRENLQWAVFQMQKELISTLRLAEAASLGAKIDRDDLSNAYDLFVSRLNLVRDGQGFQDLRQIQRLDMLLSRLTHEVGYLDDVIAQHDPSASELSQLLLLRFLPYESELQQTSVQVVHQATARNTARNQDVQGLLNWLQVLFLMNLAIIGLSLAIAFRQTLRAFSSEYRAREQEQQRRYLAESAERSKLEALGTLAGGVAHEINTPIQFVSSNMEFLSQSVTRLTEIAERVPPETLPAEMREDLDFYRSEMPVALKDAATGLARITQIVTAIKRFAHPITGQKTDVDVAEEADTAIILAKSQIKTIAEVITDIPAGLPKVRGHANELNQVFINLLVNAAQAIEEARRNQPDRPAGLIRISAEQTGADIQISLTDNGTGIPPEIADRIFDPFFTTKAIGVGTGQGLALCRKIVTDGFGGSISLDRSHAGGTRFLITLPAIV